LSHFYLQYVITAITEKKFSFEQAKEMDRMNERRPVEKMNSLHMRLNKTKSLDSGYSIFQQTHNSINSNTNSNTSNSHKNNPTINVVNFNNNDMNYSFDETNLAKLSLSCNFIFFSCFIF
jgi:hypothetical protein